MSALIQIGPDTPSALEASADPLMMQRSSSSPESIDIAPSPGPPAPLLRDQDPGQRKEPRLQFTGRKDSLSQPATAAHAFDVSSTGTPGPHDQTVDAHPSDRARTPRDRTGGGARVRRRSRPLGPGGDSDGAHSGGDTPSHWDPSAPHWDEFESDSDSSDDTGHRRRGSRPSPSPSRPGPDTPTDPTGRSAVPRSFPVDRSFSVDSPLARPSPSPSGPAPPPARRLDRLPEAAESAGSIEARGPKHTPRGPGPSAPLPSGPSELELASVGGVLRAQLGDKDSGQSREPLRGSRSESAFTASEWNRQSNGGRCRVIHPRARGKLLWDLVQSLMLLYCVFEVPLRVCFDIEPDPWSAADSVNFVIDLLFLTDVVVTFFTAFQSGGRFVTDRGQIARRYLRSYFVLDLVTSFPVTVIINAAEGEPSSVGRLPRMLRVFRLFRLLKLLRLFKLVRTMDHWGLSGKRHSVSPLFQGLKFMSVVSYLAHCGSCGFNLIPLLERAADGSFDPASWLPRYDPSYTDPSSVSVGRRYLLGVYWTITTTATVGYGDITPRTDAEVSFAVVVMFIGACMFGYIVGHISSVIVSGSETERLISDKMRSIAEYMRHRRLPTALRRRIKGHYEFTWHRGAVYDEAAILEELPPFLRNELALFLFADLIKAVPFLRDLGSDCVALLVQHLRPLQAAPGDLVFRAGALGREMYFVSKGEVEVVDRQGATLCLLSAGCYFGELAILSDEPTKRAASVRARSHAELFSLSKAAFDEVISLYPEVFTAILERAKAQWRAVADKQKHSLSPSGPAKHRSDPADPADPKDLDAPGERRPAWQLSAFSSSQSFAAPSEPHSHPQDQARPADAAAPIAAPSAATESPSDPARRRLTRMFSFNRRAAGSDGSPPQPLSTVAPPPPIRLSAADITASPPEPSDQSAPESAGSVRAPAAVPMLEELNALSPQPARGSLVRSSSRSVLPFIGPASPQLTQLEPAADPVESAIVRELRPLLELHSRMAARIDALGESVGAIERRMNRVASASPSLSTST